MIVMFNARCFLRPCWMMGRMLFRVFRRRFVFFIIFFIMIFSLAGLYIQSGNKGFGFMSRILMFEKSTTVVLMRANATELREYLARLASPKAKACKLPILDPFHESIRPYIQELGPLDCGQTRSKFENNTLTVEGNDIVAVKYRIIKRPHEDDFSVTVTDPVDVPNMVRNGSKQMVKNIEPGGSGCIVHMTSKKCLHPFGGTTNPSNGALVVFHEDCCLSRILFKMEASGVIKHVPSGLCLHSNNPVTDRSNVVLHSNCSTKFKVVNGSLQLAGSSMCLQPKTQRDIPDNDEVLVSSANCAAAYGFDSVQAQLFKGVARIQADFVRVDITHGATKTETTEVHMNTALKREVLQRTVTPAGIPVSIAMIMFDSTSAANFQRKMPKTLKYLKELPTVFLKGQTIVGDGTTAQLSAMLTGIAEEDQPEARRNMPNSKSVDDWHWVFRDYTKRGYVTMYSEDSPSLGTFNYRLKGFKNPPTDHYGRNFWLEAQKYISDFCTGNIPTHQLTMTYFLSLFRTYLDNPKFAFLLFSDLVHTNWNSISYGDEDLYNLLKAMERYLFLENTIVFIFGDHGFRFGPLRKTLQGKLEERLPHMSITFPKWFPKKHPNLFENIQKNSELLTTPFDIYATLQHILSYPLPPKGIKTGQSLLTPINPRERTCSTSGVEDHWCPCLSFEKIAVADPVVKEITAFALQHINHLLEFNSEVKRLCHKLTLKEIKIALQDLPNEKLQKFEVSHQDNKCDSCGVTFGEKATNTMSKDTLYQIQFVTSPNNGFFEASIRVKSGTPSIKGEISRVDTFGHQSDCIKDTYVHLIKYCYCRT